jgi:hypothetical protein
MPQHVPIKAGVTSRQAMFDVPVPTATRTYGPIPNADLYNFVVSRIKEQNLSITNESFGTDAGGQVMLCKLHISSNDLEMDQMLAFWNSYNKTRAVTFTTGSVVRVCSNGMMWSDGDIQRHRHYRDRWQSIQDDLGKAIDKIEPKFKKCKELRKEWKRVPIDYTNTGKLAGQLYFDNIITPRMLSDIKKETTESENFSYINSDGELRGNMWQFYNNCTQALKRSRASTYGDYNDRLTKRLAHITGHADIVMQD